MTARNAGATPPTLPRGILLLWALLVCPLLVWLALTVLLHGGPSDPVEIGVALLLVLPAALSFAAGRLGGRPQLEVVLAAVGSAAVALLIVLLQVVYLSSQGVFD